MTPRSLLLSLPALAMAAVGTALLAASVPVALATFAAAQVAVALICYSHAKRLGRNGQAWGLCCLLVPLFGPWVVAGLKARSLGAPRTDGPARSPDSCSDSSAADHFSLPEQRARRAPGKESVPRGQAAPERRARRSERVEDRGLPDSGKPPQRAEPDQDKRPPGRDPGGRAETPDGSWVGVLFETGKIEGSDHGAVAIKALLELAERSRLAGCELYTGDGPTSGKYCCVAVRAPTQTHSRALKEILKASSYAYLAPPAERLVFQDELQMDALSFRGRVTDQGEYVTSQGHRETAQAGDSNPDPPTPYVEPDDSRLDEYLKSRRAVQAAESETVGAVTAPGQESPARRTNGSLHPLVSRCLHCAYSEQREPRQWDNDPEFRKVLGPLNSGDNLAAAAQAEILVGRHPDFDTLYDWWGTALLRSDALDMARDVARRGLAAARSKYALCDLLGQIAWRAQDLEEALYWWAQGVHCQETLDTYGDTVGCYLHLHYLADGVGLPDCASALLLRVDRIHPGQVRLNAQSAASLTRLARSNADLAGPVRTVLRELVARYIVRHPTNGRLPSPEVSRLIRQLEQRDDLGLSHDDIVETVQRLGELADPAAVPALTRATCDWRLQVQLAATEALERIRHGDA